MRNAKTYGGLDADNEKDDMDADYIPVTYVSVNKVMEGKGTTWEEILFPCNISRPFISGQEINIDQKFDKPKSKSASMILQCHPKSEGDYIKMVVWNWNKGKEICTMEDGEEKDDLLCFHCMHKLGNKYIHQYVVDEIFPPGEYQPHLVLRRLEATEEKPHLVEPGCIIYS